MTTKLETIKAATILKGNRAGLIAKKFSPEILIGVGVVSIVAGTVMTVKATLKVEEVLEKSNEELAMIEEGIEMLDPEEYSEEDVKKDKIIVKTQRAVALVKLYSPAIGVTTIGIVAMLGAHRIVKKRNVALIFAYKGMEKAFEEYRVRVIEEFGEEVERRFKHGIIVEEVEEKQLNEETGRNRTVKVEKETISDGYSVYAKFFDELNPNYVKNSEYNLMFLRAQQQFATDLLRSRGHVFLNEVYKSLGIPHTGEGALVGWVLGNGDNYVDFGLYDTRGKARGPIDFVNGNEPAVLLDFNVDGLIYDKI